MSWVPPQSLIALAIEAARSSRCVKSRRGVAMGTVGRGGGVFGPMFSAYNGTPPGTLCGLSYECVAVCGKVAVHAEQRVLLSGNGAGHGMTMVHAKVIDDELVPSSGPSCWQCSKLMLDAGVIAMWLYLEDGWRRWEMLPFHVETLKNCGLVTEVAR